MFTHQFHLKYTDRWADGNEPWPIREGAKAQIFFENNLILTGHVNCATWELTDRDWSLTAKGRSASGDLEDCSAIAGTGHWKLGIPIVIINQLLADYKLKAISTVSQALLPMDHFALQEGETVYDAIDRLCKALALLPISRPDGNIELVRGSGIWQKSAGPLELLRKAHTRIPPRGLADKLTGTGAASISVGGGGPTLVVPVETAVHRRLETNDQHRHSEYFAIGQSRGSRFRAGKIVAVMKDQVKDPAIKRHRPLLLLAHHGVTSQAQLKDRATWERNVRAGHALRYVTLIPGVNAPNGKPWEPGTYCSVTDEALGLDSTMILVRANIRANSKDLATELEFTLPEAYSTLAFPAKVVNKQSKKEKPAQVCFDPSTLSAEARRALGI